MVLYCLSGDIYGFGVLGIWLGVDSYHDAREFVAHHVSAQEEGATEGSPHIHSLHPGFWLSFHNGYYGNKVSPTTTHNTHTTHTHTHNSVVSFQSSWWLNSLLWITLEYIPLLLILYILTGKPFSIFLLPLLMRVTVHERPSQVQASINDEEGGGTSTVSSQRYHKLPHDDEDFTNTTDFATTPSPSPSPSPSPFTPTSYGKSFPSALQLQGQPDG